MSALTSDLLVWLELIRVLLQCSRLLCWWSLGGFFQPKMIAIYIPIIIGTKGDEGGVS